MGDGHGVQIKFDLKAQPRYVTNHTTKSLHNVHLDYHEDEFTKDHKLDAPHGEQMTVAEQYLGTLFLVVCALSCAKTIENPTLVLDYTSLLFSPLLMVGFPITIWIYTTHGHGVSWVGDGFADAWAQFGFKRKLMYYLLVIMNCASWLGLVLHFFLQFLDCFIVSLFFRFVCNLR